MPRNATLVMVDDIMAHEEGGAARYTGLHGHEGTFGLNFRCPCGCGALHGVHFENMPPDIPGPRWKLTISEDGRLSLHPSLGLGPKQDGGYHWHGFLRDNIFEEC